MTTTVTYNGITIKNVQTRGVDYSPQYDSDGVDPMFCRLSIEVVGYVFLGDDYLENYTLGLPVTNPDGLPAAFSNVYEALLQPRRPFVMTIGGKTMFSIWPSATRGTGLNAGSRNNPPVAPAPIEHPGYKADVDNGPRPSCRILRIIGTKTLYVSFRVDAAVILCDDASANTHFAEAGIINFRWSTTEDISGDDFRTTRTTQGNFRVLSQNINVHEVVRRAFLIPPLQGNFRRQSINVSPDMSGLSASFTVIDQEMHAAPPFPATKWEARHRVSNPALNSPIVDSHLDVRLWCDRKTNKQHLLGLAIRIIDSKTNILESIDHPGKSGTIMWQADFEDDITGGSLGAHIHYRHIPVTNDPDVSKQFTRLNFLKQNFATPFVSITGIDYDPRIARVLQPTAITTGLYSILLQDGCHPAAMPQGVQFGSSPEGGPLDGQNLIGDTVEPNLEDEIPADPDPSEIPDNNPNWEQEHVDAPFMAQTVHSEIRDIGGRCAFPIAGGANDEPSRVVRFHRGMIRRYIEYHAERIDKPPPVLSQADGTIDGVEHRLLRSQVGACEPTITPDGLHMHYSIDASYEYDLAKRPANHPLPRSSWHSADVVVIPTFDPGAEGGLI